MNTIVMPRDCWMSSRSFRMAACTETSRAEVGSSQMTSRDRAASARDAIAAASDLRSAGAEPVG